MVDAGDVGGDSVAYGDFVLPSGETLVVLEVIEAVLHDVAALAGGGA